MLRFNQILPAQTKDNTGKYPDVIARIRNAFEPGTTSFIIDCEAVAWDSSSQKILPFQTLSTRARKNVKLEEIKVQVCLYAFDLLYLNGESLLRQPLRKRREMLFSAFHKVPGEFHFVEFRNLSEPDEIQEFLMEAVAGSCEGLMVKTLDTDSTYEPSRRSFNWLKVKKDYMDGMTDTVDLVPIGAYLGRGKRTGVFGLFSQFPLNIFSCNQNRRRWSRG